MATQLYVTCRSHGSNLLGPPGGDWSGGDTTRENRGHYRFTFRLADTATDGGVSTTVGLTANEDTSKTNNQALLAWFGAVRWATDLLDTPVLLNGTLDITLKVATAAAAAGGTAGYRLFAYISDGDSLDVKHVLVDNVSGTINWTGTMTWRTQQWNLSGETAEAGDRIVLEIGADVSPPTAPPGDSQFTMAWGTTNTSDVVQADGVNGSTAAGAAWVSFSNTLSFAAAPSPPSNDACLDAITITSLPFQDAGIDSTTSADTNRSIWYTWTATENQRIFGNVWGSNYWIWLRGWQGSCASKSLIHLHTTGNTNSFTSPTITHGRSQASIWFDAIAGTQYWFQIANIDNNDVAPNAQLGAKNSGGYNEFRLYANSAPADNDLFVDCQQIVCFRNGLPMYATSEFYGSTPTNSCIDYTHRPLDDLNGGTNTNLRLYVDLFGSNPLVEILDLDTFNNGEAEVDFIRDPLNYANNSENLASIVMDASGRIVMGYFGDNYDVVGQLSTPDACRVNRIDATHADNQTGAPWPDAEKFTVDQDVGGSDYVEVTQDQVTMYYTSSGREILTYNLSTASQGPVFATLPVQGAEAPRPGARGLRLLSPYDGSGGMLVTYGNVVHRLNGSGALVQTYTPSQPNFFKDMDKLELTSDGRSFWSSDQYSAHMVQFDIESGAETFTFDTKLPPGQLCGFTNFGYRGTPTPPTFNTVTTVPIRRLRRSPVTAKENKWISISKVEIDLQRGFGTATGQGSDPIVMFRFSYDGGYSWSNQRDLSEGARGDYNARAITYMLGQGRAWVMEVVVSDPVVPWVLLDLFYDPEEGLD